MASRGASNRAITSEGNGTLARVGTLKTPPSNRRRCAKQEAQKREINRRSQSLHVYTALRYSFLGTCCSEIDHSAMPAGTCPCSHRSNRRAEDRWPPCLRIRCPSCSAPPAGRQCSRLRWGKAPGRCPPGKWQEVK